MENINKSYKLKKTYLNKGYLGIGDYTTKINGVTTKQYKVWGSMLDRCYSSKFHKNNNTYIDCTVCEEWLNYQIFAKWFDEQYIKDCQLDKDILFKGNKIYSPETCCFVPYNINMLLSKCNNYKRNLPYGVTKSKTKVKTTYHTEISIDNKRINLGTFSTPLEAFNIYKLTKEKEIKRKANQYKNIISKTCYLALINYKVEITD